MHCPGLLLLLANQYCVATAIIRNLYAVFRAKLAFDKIDNFISAVIVDVKPIGLSCVVISASILPKGCQFIRRACRFFFIADIVVFKSTTAVATNPDVFLLKTLFVFSKGKILIKFAFYD